MTSDGPAERDVAEAHTASPPPVLAAGGVVLHTRDDVVHVLVVHRPAYDDWSLPKGHVDDGERLEDTARREVTEETGVTVRIVREAGTTEHDLGPEHHHAIKRVHWFLMHPDDAAADPSARAPDVEVDRASWWPVRTALTDLTYKGERELLARTVLGTVDGHTRTVA